MAMEAALFVVLIAAFGWLLFRIQEAREETNALRHQVSQLQRDVHRLERRLEETPTASAAARAGGLSSEPVRAAERQPRPAAEVRPLEKPVAESRIAPTVSSPPLLSDAQVVPPAAGGGRPGEFLSK